MNDYVTKKELKEVMEANNAQLTRSIVSEMGEVLDSMMSRIDERFNKVEADIADLKESQG